VKELQTSQATSEIPIDFRSPVEDYKDNPGNAEVERLVAKLDTLRNGTVKQVVLITSAILGEGKSTVASHIAISSAHNRKSPTLLIDFDLRRPTQHRIFGVSRRYGVIDILTLKKPLKDCIRPTSFPNLLLLPSGRLEKDSPIGLLKMDRVKRMFGEVRNSFDNVIVDSPPIIPVCDPLVLAKVVDHVMLVVKAGSTSKHVVGRAIDMLQDVNVKVRGIILNNLKNILPCYYDHNSYTYEYYKYHESREG
jgi:capsular exopolysaccharide synthesis family protein